MTQWVDGGHKKKLAGDGAGRLRWKVLRAFGALPTEERARAMRDRDYVWCLTHMALDQEEELSRLCPGCRARAEEIRCPVCGRPAESWEGAVNPSFDQARYERLLRGEER